MVEIKAEERKSLILLSLMLFTIIASLVMMKSARDALTLSHFSYRALPYFMLAATAGVFMVAVTYLRLYQKFNLIAAIVASLTLFGTVTIFLWHEISMGKVNAIPFLYVWVNIFGAVAPVHVWSLLSQTMRARDARKSIGWLGAGGIAGSILGGFAVRLVAGRQVVDLLLAASVLMIIPIIAALLLRRQDEVAEEPPVEESKPQVTKRFIVLLLIIILAGNVVSTFIDFQFKVTSQRELQSAEKMARFFGFFYAYLGITSLIFQLILTPILMRRLKLTFALTITPIALLIGNVSFLTIQRWWPAVFLKGGEQLFKHSLERSALEVLWMSVPEALRVKFKSLIDTVGYQGSEALGAIVLVLLYSIGNTYVAIIAFVNIGLIALWIWASIKIGSEYPQLLEETIDRKTVDLEEVKNQFLTENSYRLVRELKNAKDETLVDVLKLIESSHEPGFAHYLESLLDNNRPEIRLRTLRLLFQQNNDLSPRIKRLLENEKEREVKVEAAHYLSCRAGKKFQKEFNRLLHDSDPAVQAAACSWGLSERAKDSHRKTALAKLSELISSSRKDDDSLVRAEVAHVLELAKPSSEVDDLNQEILFDPDPDIRKSVLRGIARSSSPGLIPNVIECLRDSEIRNEARETLVSYGEMILPELKKIIENKNELLELRREALRCAADVGGSEALHLIVSVASESDVVIRFSAIKALNRMRKRESLESWTPLLEKLLQQELETVEQAIRWTRAFSPRKGGLMESVMKQHIYWARQRIFRLLGLLYQPQSMYNAYLALVGSDFNRADAAIELLDASLNPEHRSRILPLLDLEELESGEASEEDRKDALFFFIRQKDPLTIAAVIADLPRTQLNEWKEEIWRALAGVANHPLIHETLTWRYSKMEGTDNKQQMGTIQKMEYLSKIDIFAELGPHELLLLTDQSAETAFHPEEVIYTEGEIARSIFCLVRGKVELLRASGHKEILTAGESFGTLAALTRRPRVFSAKALEECLCLKLDREIFWEIIDDYPAICQGIFEVLVKRIEALTEHDQHVTTTKA